MTKEDTTFLIGFCELAISQHLYWDNKNSNNIMWHSTNVFTAHKKDVAFTCAEYAFIRKELRAPTPPSISVTNVAS